MPRIGKVEPANQICDICNEAFTKVGIQLHRGTKKCRKRASTFKIREDINSLREDLEKRQKRRIFTGVAQAIERRGMAEFCGLEKAETKFVHDDEYNIVPIQENWVYGWLQQCWQKYRDLHETDKFYKWLEKISRLSEEEKEKEKGLIILSQVDNV